jgi:transcriptional regulator with XRE-family HTH domain
MAPTVPVDGKKIQKLRLEKLAYTQTELAAQIGISKAAMWLIENKTQRTSPQTLRKLSKALGVKPQQLVNSKAVTAA